MGECLGLEPIRDGIWGVYFYWKRIGILDELKMNIVDTYGKMVRAYVLPMHLAKLLPIWVSVHLIQGSRAPLSGTAKPIRSTEQ